MTGFYLSLDWTPNIPRIRTHAWQSRAFEKTQIRNINIRNWHIYEHTNKLGWKKKKSEDNFSWKWEIFQCDYTTLLSNPKHAKLPNNKSLVGK
jgi:hypothetical protein